MRNTGDIDIWIEVTPDNAKALESTPKEFIRNSPSVKAILKRPYILQIGNPPNRVDVFSDIKGVKFDECFKRRVNTIKDGVPVSLINFKDLLASKRAAARDKDIMDVAQLEKYHKIAKRKKKK